MTNDPNKKKAALLIAQMRAHLVSGASYDLLPIKHEQDVKSEVESLVESWAESGFLVHGRFVYPWHQVKFVEVTQVEEMPLELAHQRYEELYAAKRTRTQEDFWRTRQNGKRVKGKGKEVAHGRRFSGNKSRRGGTLHAGWLTQIPASTTSVPTRRS